MRVRKRLLGSVLTVMLTTATVGSALAQQAPDEQVDSPPTGLVGRVVLATRCPVPVGDADDGVCPAPGLQSTVTVRSGDGSTAVAQVATDEAGGFSIPLDPGAYLVDVPTATAGTLGVQTLAVTVAADGPTALVIRVPVGFHRLP